MAPDNRLEEGAASTAKAAGCKANTAGCPGKVAIMQFESKAAAARQRLEPDGQLLAVP